jgi:hypothetical protein
MVILREVLSTNSQIPLATGLGCRILSVRLPHHFMVVICLTVRYAVCRCTF